MSKPSLVYKQVFNKFYANQSYHDYLQNPEKQNHCKHRRYVKYSEREETSEMTPEALLNIGKGKYLTTWKDVTLMKCGTDLIAYQQLMWELKPKTIFEFGTACGGSALWMSDIMSSYGMGFHIYTMDINTEQCHPTAKTAKNVTFLPGDSFKAEECFTPEMLQKAPRPWLIIEDAHMNVFNIMNYLHKYLKRGDYLILEDVNELTESFYPAGFDGIPNENKDGEINFCLIDWEKSSGDLNQVRNKKEEMVKFIKDHDDDYVVDAKIQDMFGYNFSWNMNSTFMKL